MKSYIENGVLYTELCLTQDDEILNIESAFEWVRCGIELKDISTFYDTNSNETADFLRKSTEIIFSDGGEMYVNIPFDCFVKLYKEYKKNSLVKIYN